MHSEAQQKILDNTFTYHMRVNDWEVNYLKDKKYIVESLKRGMSVEFLEFMQARLLIKQELKRHNGYTELTASVCVLNQDDILEIWRCQKLQSGYQVDLELQLLKAGKYLNKRMKARQKKTLKAYAAGLQRAVDMLAKNTRESLIT